MVRLPPQCTFWRFLASLHGGVSATAGGAAVPATASLGSGQRGVDRGVLDTDTTVHTLFGNQMGARKSYNPKNKGKKSFQPILTFLAETKEYIAGELRNGDRPRGKRSRPICRWCLPLYRRW